MTYISNSLDEFLHSEGLLRPDHTLQNQHGRDQASEECRETLPVNGTIEQNDV